MNSRIIKNTLICFSKLCHDRGEKPYFYGRENQKIINFFERKFENYPEIFTHDLDIIENELDNANYSGFIGSLGVDYHPSFPPKNLHKYYNKVENKEVFDKIALDFYNELGCNLDGKLGERTKISREK